MTLRNLLRTGQLEEHETDSDQVRRMLDSARRSIADAKQDSISQETRFDAAYRAITQICTVALWANGYRTSRNRPGHHQVMIQSLVHSVGLANERVRLLDTFRIKRNAIDYTGDDVDGASLGECVAATESLLQHVLEWLSQNKPDLVVFLRL